MRAFSLLLLASVVYAGALQESSAAGDGYVIDCSKYPNSGPVTLRGTVRENHVELETGGPALHLQFCIDLPDGCTFRLYGLAPARLRALADRDVEITGEMTLPPGSAPAVMVQSMHLIPHRVPQKT